MSLHKEITGYFDRFPEHLMMGIYTQKHYNNDHSWGMDEVFVLTDEKGTRYKTSVFELGESIIEFLYDPAFELIVRTLLESQSYVKGIMEVPDDVTRWEPFYSLLQSAPSQFFYFFLAQEIVTAYKNKLRRPDGTPYPEDYFCKIGRSYQWLREQMENMVAVCLVEENSTRKESASERYCKHFSKKRLTFRNISWEAVSEKLITEVLYPQTPEDIGNFLFCQYLKENATYKRCGYCRKLFVVTGRSNIRYCNRIDEKTGKTCRQTSPAKVFRESRKCSPGESAYNRAYKTNYSRISAGKLSKEQFKKWSEKARQKRDECAAGKLSVEDFERWLEIPVPHIL